MNRTLTLITLLAASPGLAHPSMVPHDHDAVSAFSPLAAGIALGLVAFGILAAPRLRAVMARVSTR